MPGHGKGDSVSETAQPDNLVRIEEVTKRYGEVEALRGVTFAIRKGEILGYVGPNGAGKTTTIKILAGLLDDFGGVVQVGPHKMPGEKNRAYGMLGYLPQHTTFHDWRSIQGTLRMFGRLSGLEGSGLEDRIDEVLAKFALTEKRHVAVGELSGGQRQKVGLAQAILHRPDLLILDEPMVGLDPPGRYQVKKILQALNEAGSTIFFSSHILSDIQDIASRLVILKRGRLAFTGTIQELRSRFDSINDVALEAATGSPGWWPDLSLPGLVETITEPSGRHLLRFEADTDLQDNIDRVLKHLVEQGHRIRSIGPAYASLEELYIRFIKESAE